jgi:uncharacterized protein
MKMAMGGAARVILWQRLDTPGLERCLLQEHAHGARLQATVLVLLDAAPCEVRYSVELDVTWRTRLVDVSCMLSGEARLLRLEADGAGAWRLDGQERPDLVGCLDVDLGVSPSTNTLPIRRLRLEPGQGAAARAAWVRFPDLQVSVLEQRYERLGERRYRYSSPGFSAELGVDSLGLVEEYAGLFRMLARG